jgi:hypothetical protein
MAAKSVAARLLGHSNAISRTRTARRARRRLGRSHRLQLALCGHIGIDHGRGVKQVRPLHAAVDRRLAQRQCRRLKPESLVLCPQLWERLHMQRLVHEHPD